MQVAGFFLCSIKWSEILQIHSVFLKQSTKPGIFFCNTTLHFIIRISVWSSVIQCWPDVEYISKYLNISLRISTSTLFIILFIFGYLDFVIKVKQYHDMCFSLLLVLKSDQYRGKKLIKKRDSKLLKVITIKYRSANPSIFTYHARKYRI